MHVYCTPRFLLNIEMGGRGGQRNHSINKNWYLGLNIFPIFPPGHGPHSRIASPSKFAHNALWQSLWCKLVIHIFSLRIILCSSATMHRVSNTGWKILEVPAFQRNTVPLVSLLASLLAALCAGGSHPQRRNLKEADNLSWNGLQHRKKVAWIWHYVLGS